MKNKNISDLLGCKLGFGTLRLPLLNGNVDLDVVTGLVDAFIAGGGKYFEAAYSYFQCEYTIKSCLVERYPRDRYLLADKMPINSIHQSKEYEEIFREQLERCGVDYFDFYLLHNVGKSSYLSTEKLGGFDFLKQMKDAGKVKYIGFSFHDSADLLNEILDKYHEIIDFVQLQINYLDWESPVIQSGKCYETAVKYDMPVFVMEPVKGGRLADGLPKKAAVLLKNSAPSYAIRWVSDLENVVCILSGMTREEQVLENLDSVNRKITQEENDLLKRVVEIIKSESKISCTNCRYCVPVCPKKIPIPELFHLYENDNNGRMGGMYERVCNDAGKASDCLKCGKCEKVCSQKIEIRKWLAEIAESYEKKSFGYRMKIMLISFLKRIHVYYFIRRILKKR